MSDDLLPFVRLVQHAKPAGRGAELFLECGHKITVAGDEAAVKSLPCSRCIAAFHDEEARRKWDYKLYAILQECRSWVHCPDAIMRLDESIATLRRRLENPQETLRK